MNQRLEIVSSIYKFYPGHLFIFVSVKGVTSAMQIVQYCTSRPMFREVQQKKYLHAITTRRSYHNLTRAEVDRMTSPQLLQDRAVKTFGGG